MLILKFLGMNFRRLPEKIRWRAYELSRLFAIFLASEARLCSVGQQLKLKKAVKEGVGVHDPITTRPVYHDRR
jgi:hypothetical protein